MSVAWALADEGTDHSPLGPETAVKTIEAMGHLHRAQAAVELALRLSEPTSTNNRRTDPTVTTGPPAQRGIGL